MADERLLRENRIRSRADFQRIYSRRCSAADDVLVIHACENAHTPTRLGLAVSRRVGNAVARNRWKRLIREAFRLTRSRLPAATDLVVAPRRGATPSLEAIKSSLPKLAARLARKLERTTS